MMHESGFMAGADGTDEMDLLDGVDDWARVTWRVFVAVACYGSFSALLPCGIDLSGYRG